MIKDVEKIVPKKKEDIPSRLLSLLKDSVIEKELAGIKPVEKFELTEITRRIIAKAEKEKETLISQESKKTVEKSSKSMNGENAN